MSDDEAAPATRAPGEGSITRLASGRFRLRMPLDGARTSQTFDTYEEADAVRRAFIAQLAAEHAAGGPPTLARFGARKLDEWEAERVGRNHAAERSMFRLHVAPASIGLVPMVNLQPEDVRHWIRDVARTPALAPRWRHDVEEDEERPTTGRPLAHGTVKHVLNLARKLLGAAVECGHLRANPAADIEPPPAPATPLVEDPWTYLEQTEIDLVLNSPAVPRWARQLYTVAIYTGLRQGELWGLHWPHAMRLEGERPEIEVRFSHDGPPKNGRVRHVPLPEPARAALVAWKRECAVKHPEGLVFVTPRGHGRGRSDDAGWADEVRERDAEGRPTVRLGHKTLAGITRRVRFHDLRHTCASHLVMGTWGTAWTLEEVCAYLGHSSIEVTQRYAHLSPAHLHSRVAQTTGARRVRVPQGENLAGHAQDLDRAIALEITRRAMSDSNARPLAPEATAVPRSCARLAPVVTHA